MKVFGHSVGFWDLQARQDFFGEWGPWGGLLGL